MLLVLTFRAGAGMAVRNLWLLEDERNVVLFGTRVFSVIPPPPPQRIIYPPPPAEAVAATTSVFTEYVFCESVDNAHNSEI